MSVSKKTLEHPVLVFIIFALLCVVGLFTLSNVAIDLFPETEFPMIVVLTTYPNAGPESVEKSVTKTLEDSLVSVSNLKDMYSTSSEGVSTIQLEFLYGTNLDEATNDVRDKIDMVKRRLPDAAEAPSIFKMDASALPIMRIALRGNRSAEDLRQIADDYVQPRLEQTAGVAQANSSGGREKIVRVEISQNRLDAYGLTLTGISQSLSTQNLEMGGGKITESSKNYLIRTTGEFSSIEQISQTVVGIKNGYAVKLKDVGSVFSGYKDEESSVYINGNPGVYVSITKQSGQNSVRVADSVYEKLEELNTILPSDVSLEIISDNTEQIRETIASLLESAYSGILLAMAILFVFLRSVKSTIIIGVSIPLSIVITLISMNFAGITLNMMTMTGLILGIGMVVDASIVILENIYTYRSRGARPKMAAILGSKEVLISVLSGNLTTMCVFVPFIIYKTELGIMGMMFQDIIFTICIALASSLVVAIFLVPVLAGYFIPLSNPNEKQLKNGAVRKLDHFGAAVMDRITRVYERGLKVVLGHRKITVAVVVLILGASIAVLPTLNINLMPPTNDKSVTLNVTMPVGTPLDDTRAVLFQFQSFVEEEIKGYDTTIVTVGGGRMRSVSSESYTGSLSIQLPESDKQIDTSQTIKEKLRVHFGDFPQAVFSFDQGMGGSISGADIDIAIRSDDLDAAMETARSIQDLMDRLPDVSETTIDINDGLPQVEVVIDRDRAYSFGVSVSAAANEINACVNGITATIYRSSGKEYDVDVMYRPEDRQKTVDLENIYVNGSSGRVALSNFASLEKGTGPVNIKRENQTRIIHITATILTNTRADEVEKKISQLISDNMVVPDTVSIAFEGSWKDITENMVTYALIIVLAVLLVFGVMAGTYESFKDPFINLLTIPLLIIGVVAVHLISGQAFSLTSAIGIIMLVGIVVNNGIILVDYTNLLVDRGTPLMEACLQAGSSRLRPVLMTTLTTIFGMLPMCFNTSGSAAMIQPIGLSVVGGLTSSTLVTLFFVPVVYSLMSGKKKQKGAS